MQKPSHELKPKASMPENNKYHNQQAYECPDVYNENENDHHLNIERRRSGDFENQPKENRFPFGQKPFAFHDIQKHEQNYQNFNQRPDYNPYPNNQNQNAFMNQQPQMNNFEYYGRNNNNPQMNPEFQDDPYQNYNDPRNNYNNFNKNKEYKDPDVWDPAPPLKPKKTNKNVSKPKTTPSSNPSKPNQKPLQNNQNNQNQNQKDK